MQIGSAPGGANDAYARLLARHMGRHIPGNPTVVAQNVVGAGSLVLANQLFTSARRDGTVFGQLQRTLLLDPLLVNKPFIIKPLEFNWLGSLNRETNVLIVAANTPVKTLDDAKVHEIVMAAEGVETDGVVYPRLVNKFLGTKFRVVPGYDGDANMMLAIDRGEAQGRGGVPWSALKLTSADRLKRGSIRVISQLGMKKHAELAHVPMLLDAVTKRYRAQGARDLVRAAGHGTAVRDAAGRAACARRDVARSLRRHHPRPGVPAGGRQAEVRDRPDGRQGDAGADGRPLRHAEGRGRRDQADSAGGDEAVTPRRQPSW